jgi:Transposase IS66 family
MKLAVPHVAVAEQTPLVRRLLEFIVYLLELVRQLKDEIARLKGLKTRPKIRPCPLEKPQPPRRKPRSRLGEPASPQDRRPKAERLPIHDTVVLLPPDLPEGSTLKDYEETLVQGLTLEPHNVLYRRARYQTPDGRIVLAPLPATAAVAGRHFSPTLVTYLLDQHYNQRVPQQLILEQLWDWGIDISEGEVNALLTERLDVFHQEKDELLPVALEVSPYIQVDDTGARHQGHNGYCTYVGNDWFASFTSTGAKSRLNFLEVLRGPDTDYVLNDIAFSYLRQHNMPATVLSRLATAQDQTFVDAAAWQAALKRLEVTAKLPVRLASEAALLGSVMAHGCNPKLVILSDDAGQFGVLTHAQCWIHGDRRLARLNAFNDEYQQAQDGVRERLWDYYAELKAYRARPTPARKAELPARFETLFTSMTPFATINEVLRGIHKEKAEFLRVLERPEVPLHNNVAEGDIREYVSIRKVSGGTRSDLGRRCRDTFASLKKTCRKSGVSFWDYLVDRLTGAGGVPRLTELIRRQAAEWRAKKAAAAPESRETSAAGNSQDTSGSSPR